MIKRTAFIFVLLLLSLVFPSCKQVDEATDNRREYHLEIKIAYSGNAKPVLLEVAEEAIASLNLSQRTVVKYTKIDGYEDAVKYGRGQIKVDAWLSPSSTLIDVVNQNVAGLGTKVLDCESVFATPVVISMFEEDADKIGVPDRFIPSSMLVSSAEEEKIWLAMPDPRISSTGLIGLYQFNESLDKKDINKALESLQQATWSNSVRSQVNIGTSIGQRRRFPVVVTTEQEFSTYGADQMRAYYVDGGSAWLNYGFCISSAESLNKDKLKVLKAIQQTLLSTKWQTKAKRLGYRPVIAVTPVEALSPAKGIDPLLPKDSLRPPRAEEAEALITKWSEAKRNSATAILLDTSSSMEGEPLSNSAGVVRAITQKLLEQDGKVSLIRFSNTVDQNTPFVTSTSYIDKRLREARPIGGSALHDSIKRAFELLADKNLSGYQKRIVFISDGPDSSSRIHVKDLEKIIGLDYNGEPIIIVGVFLTDYTSAPQETKRLVEKLGGIIFETKLETLPYYIDEVLGAL